MNIFFQNFGLVIIIALMIIIAIKVIWNFGLPYAMGADKSGRGWSIFPLIEFIPLLMAILVAWVTCQNGNFTTKNLLIYGGGAIVVSYLHFCVIAVIFGIIRYEK